MTASISLEEYLTTTFESDRDFVDGHLEERNWGEWGHGRLQAKIGSYLFSNYEPLGMRATMELRLRVAPDRVRIPDLCLFLTDPHERVPATPPFLCIEILSPKIG